MKNCWFSLIIGTNNAQNIAFMALIRNNAPFFSLVILFQGMLINGRANNNIMDNLEMK